WQRDLAVAHLKRMSAFRGEADVKKRASADQTAYDTGVNTLNITSRLMPTYKDFELLGVAKPARLNKRWRSFRAWMSFRPPWTPAVVPTLLDRNNTPITEPLSTFFKELPEQIGFFMLRDVRQWDVRRVAAFAQAVYVSYSVYTAPMEENERSNTHSARATPSFSKRPVFNDVVLNAILPGAGRAKAGGKEGGVGGSEWFGAESC
ncbi:hypothetical protein KFL_016250010, partial [Klebsormidium nitens]